MILFVQTAFLGDLLLSIPALRQLRSAYPNKEIHLVCRKGLGRVIQSYGLVDCIHDDFKNTKPTLSEWRERFSDKTFDLLICPHESTRSMILSWFVHAKHKLGFQSFFGRFVFDKMVERPMQWPEALRQLFLIQSVVPGLDEQMTLLPKTFQIFKNIPPWASMVLWTAEKKLAARESICVKKNFDPARAIVAIAPGSVWPTKRWPVDGFTDVAKKYIDQGATVIIVGSKDERVFGDAIKSAVHEVHNLCGETNLVELTEVLAACDLLISNDSGAMHMAATTNTPIVTIFGPTVLEFGYQPWSNQFTVVEIEGLKCRPCSSHGGLTCPIGTHECMKMIRSDRVILAARSFLDIK